LLNFSLSLVTNKHSSKQDSNQHDDDESEDGGVTPWLKGVKEQHLVGVARAKNGKKGNETGLIHLQLANHLIELSLCHSLMWENRWERIKNVSRINTTMTRVKMAV
jgi:hypothetical protein